MMPQEQLLAAEIMPRRAQEHLPVLPNNGNPRTIYNMPGTGGNTPAEQVQPNQQVAGQPPVQAPTDKSPYFYPWMAPSPSVDRIRQMIRPLATAPVAPTQPAILQQPQTAVLPQTTAPILPMRRGY